MAGMLASSGYKISDNMEAADVWVLNSCTVKNPSQDVFVNYVNDARRLGKRIIAAGCVPQADPKNDTWEGVSVIGVQQVDRVVEVVEETLKGNTVVLLAQKRVEAEVGPLKKRKAGGASLDLPKIRKNKFVEIIPINTGCLNQCTYCKTKQARGDLGSYSVDEIVARVKAVIAEGVVEIWLTSEDTGTYGRDIETSLPILLWSIIPHLPPGVMLRVGMTNPPYILEHLEEMAKVLSHPRVYAFLHVPVQAASNHVLEDMKRKYTREEFEQVADFLIARVPNITIATDVICGFPTETPEDFEETLQLVDKYKFPVLHISQFYPRPGTPAARLKRVKTEEVKRRSRAVTILFDSYTTYQDRVGQVLNVLVTEECKDGVHVVAHAKSYEQVLIPRDLSLLGKMATVKIVSSSKWHIVGHVIDSEHDSATLHQSTPATSTTPKSNISAKTTTATTSSSQSRVLNQQTNSAPSSRLPTSPLFIAVLVALVAVLLMLCFSQTKI
eukprot:c6369_g1_i1.p1 GENE.c6369_g1_i1~~c6369_g1_i1.p1  ORF type:complete len:498 (-),score=130.11 c6369_g1_i1:252-1745(-)